MAPALSWSQEFQFKFAYKGQAWSHSVNADNWQSAFEEASQKCFDHFTGSHSSQKVRLDEISADTLLDTCINPR
jgi:hypothetical protein